MGKTNANKEMDTVMGLIRMGVNVDIKRSDGRIHSAVVSGINLATKSVTVEWFERGETKGKEIELEAILGLNQDLAPAPTTTNSYAAETNDNNVIQTNAKNSSKIPARGGGQIPVPAAAATNNRAVAAARLRNPARQSHVVSRTAAAADADREVGNNRNNAAADRIENNSNSMPPPMAVPPATAPAGGRGGVGPVGGGETVSKAAAAAAAGGSNRRRSNVVKEVEKLKENREKRRERQAQILEEKEAARNIDPGNPNWEFLTMIYDYKDQLEFRPLQDGDPLNNHQITVCVRKRPLSQKEMKRKEVDVTTCPNKDQVIIHQPMTKVDLTKYLDNNVFRFDYAFDENATNELVYKYTARPLVQSIFDGGMATCFAYGQTGSGKTHTMGGEFHGKSQDCKNGIYALAARDVFKMMKSPKYKDLNVKVGCSYFEIYSGKLFDLLSGKSKLRVLEDGKQQVQVVGLTEKVVDCEEDVINLIIHGSNIRTSGQTSANQNSSRSHAVFQIILRHNNNKKSLFGKFSLIDLAGNERGADTSSANRQTRMEGAEINKSLLALKECIRALGRKGAHLPFRASKLTQVLRDSFIGDKAKTCMIAMVSPTLSSCEHTLNTLRYADRVKELGAGDPTKPSQQMSLDEEDEEEGLDEMRMDDGVMSPENSDLAQLRSLNDGECSADWYNFQESVAHLQQLEEEVVENHRFLLDNMEEWLQQDVSLLAMTNEVDYDQDAYAQQLEDMIAEKQEALAALREKTIAFRTCLREEELQSKEMNLRK